MKKPDKKREAILRRKREKKSLKNRKKKGKYDNSGFGISYSEKLTKWQLDLEKKVIADHNFELDEFLNAVNPNSNYKFSTEFRVKGDFNLESNFKKVFKTLRNLRYSIFHAVDETILIDFTDCTSIDFSSLFLMRVLIDEYRLNKKRLNNRLKLQNVYPTIRIKESQVLLVNKKLLSCEIIKAIRSPSDDEDGAEALYPVSAFKLQKGQKSRTSYRENKKGKVATGIRNYINECLKRYGVELNPNGSADLDGIISETLNNAEDHSQFNTWYAFGNFFNNNIEGEEQGSFVGEINLAFMNFGFSIFDGIEENKIKNKDQYNEIENLFNSINAKDRWNTFSKENLFSLYALQDGISRMKYENESRGTGTMTFIRSFQSLGDYEDVSMNFIPKLCMSSN